MSLGAKSTKAVEIFCSYAHKDVLLWHELEKHLSLLRSGGVITPWHVREISADSDWEQEIDQYQNKADIILLLVSPEFLASDYCYSVEVLRAVQRHEKGEARLIPIILRPCYWKGTPFDRFQVLPTDAKAVTLWENRDEAFLDVARGIRAATQELNTQIYEPEQNTTKDFFISYDNADRSWAEWVGWQLENAGYSVILQAWDLRPGSNVILDMQNAIQAAKRTIVLLSPSYLRTAYTRPEWAAASVQDPTGQKGTLLPIRVRESDVSGIFGPVVYLDLVGSDEETARKKLLEGVSSVRGRRKPVAPPTFPGRVRHSLSKQPYFPEALADAQKPALQEASPAIWNIPYLSKPFFTGREEILESLHHAFQSGQKTLVTQALSGMGGIGKTQLAVEYAYRYKNEHKAVLWAKADTRDALISDFVVIADLLNVPQRSDQDQNLTISAVKQWLSTNIGWLLILDNAENLELIKEFIPAQGQGHILLTTRRPIEASTIPGIKVEAIERGSGILFLLRRASLLAFDEELERVTPQDRELAEIIVKELGDLPLAIDLAGAYIEEAGCTLTEYEQSFQVQRNALAEQEGLFTPLHPASVTAACLLSQRMVEPKVPAAADILRLCAFLHPDAILEEIITGGANVLGPHIEKIANDLYLFNDALNQLHRLSLLYRDFEAKTVSIHPVIQALLKDSMDEGTQHQWAERAVLAVNQTFPEVGVASLQRCQLFLPHARACALLIEQEKIQSAEAASLLDRMGYYLCLRAQYEEAEPLFMQALAISDAMQDLVSIGFTVYRLAKMYHMQKKYEGAEDYYRIALNVYEYTQKETDPSTVQILSDLAGLYSEQGRYTEAMPLYEEALANWGPSLDQDPANFIQSLNNLAEIYRTQGKHDQVEHLLERALSIGENALGSDHPVVTSILYRLAGSYAEQRRYSEAEVFYRRALTILEQTSTDKLGIAINLDGLATLYTEQGRYKEAEGLYRRALAILEEELTDRSREVLVVSHLAFICERQQKYAEAEPLYQRALTILEQELGTDHPAVAEVLSGLALIYERQRRYEEAEPLYQRVLTILEQELVTNHPAVAEILSHLASIYERQQRYKEAEELYQRALTILNQKLGSEHPTVANTLENLSALYIKQGRYEEAEPLYQRALSIRQKALGPKHPAVATTMQALADLYTKTGKYDLAESLYRETISMYQKQFGPRHPHVAQALRTYADFLKTTQRYDEAGKVEAEAKAIRSRR